MEQIKGTLDPLLNGLPEGIRDYWMVIFCAAALAVLLPVAWYQRRIIRVLVVGPRAPARAVLQPSEEDLTATPMPAGSVGVRRLVVEGVPARIRLVVLAPHGMGSTIDESAAEEILNNVIWGLGSIAGQDKPRIVVWPPQLSAHGFAAVFHRLTRKPEADGQPSRWVLVGGPTPPRPRPILLGLGLWTDEPTTIGRLSMQANQWVASIHIQSIAPDIPTYPSVEEPRSPSVTGQGDVRDTISNDRETAAGAVDLPQASAPNAVPHAD